MMIYVMLVASCRRPFLEQILRLLEGVGQSDSTGSVQSQTNSPSWVLG